jgi:CheY-like chemotaxis protein/anti-anti-sigma regulatory factor
MTPKILTVDDSRTIRMIIKKAFMPYVCELFEAENGMEGLSQAAKEKPDLIILDITMPVMNGIEMLHKLKEVNELKDIPVVMLTAESGKDNVMSIVKMGVKDYVVKPFKGEQLVERVQNLMTLKPRIDQPADAKEDSEDGLFSVKGDVVVLTLPEKISRTVSAQIDGAVKERANQMNAAGARKLLIDLSRVKDLSMTAIQLIISLINNGARAKLLMRLTASDSQKEALKGFQETSAITTWPSIELAVADF